MSLRVKLPAPVVPRPADAVIVVDELVMDGYCDLPLWMIRVSRTNRTYFNVDALQQLANNIADVGILQPILVRPVTPTDEHPQYYEIVAGERRFRAAIMAGLFTAPLRVRRMSDLQAAELQLVENLQREDPHPLEEAEGMQLLMQNHGYNADQVAAAVKQSRSYVYGRLKLCNLATSVREQFMGEQFNASIGLLLARLPTPDLQARAAKAVHQHELSYRDAQDYIRRTYMLDLKHAVFSMKDAKLVEAAGACTTCPKRAGNQPDIYPDEKDANICTEPACFNEKTAAFEQRKRDQATKKGMAIITGDAARKIMPSSYGNLRGGYSDLDKRMYLSTGATTYREILGKDLPQVSLLANPHERGKYIEVARTDELEDLVEAKAGKGKTEASQAAAAKAREKKQEREAAIERQYRKDLFMAVRLAAAGTPLYDNRELAVLMFRNCPDYVDAMVRKVWGWDTDDFKSGWSNGGKEYLNNTENVYKAIRALEHDQAGQLVRDMLLARDLAVNTYIDNNAEPAALLAAAHELGVDAPAIRAELAKAAKAKEKEKADKAKKKAAKATKPAQAEIAMEPCAQGPVPAQPVQPATSPAALTLDALAGVDLSVWAAANPGRLDEATRLIIDDAPHLLSAFQRACERVGYAYSRDGWKDAANRSASSAESSVADAALKIDRVATAVDEQPADSTLVPRKTLTLKPKAIDDAPAGTDQAGPIVRVKKPARVITLPGAVAYASPDNAAEGEA